ncbi:hypothetical protein AB3S75_015892 [Citrus x aurantiifolia]
MTATSGVVSLSLMFHRIDGFDLWRLMLRKFMSWLLMIAEGELCNSLDQESYTLGETPVVIMMSSENILARIDRLLTDV